MAAARRVGLPVSRTRAQLQAALATVQRVGTGAACALALLAESSVRAAERLEGVGVAYYLLTPSPSPLRRCGVSVRAGWWNQGRRRPLLVRRRASLPTPTGYAAQPPQPLAQWAAAEGAGSPVEVRPCQAAKMQGSMRR